MLFLVFTEECDRFGLLLVDQRVNMLCGTRVNMKSVTAAEAAALSAWSLLKATDRVGALVFNDAKVTHLETPPNAAMLNRVLESAAQLAGHDHLVVVISDFDGADDDTQRWLR